MGIPLTIFDLYRLDGDGEACPHHLLLRVEQPGFSNADAAEYDHAVQLADARRRALIGRYQARVLARDCPAVHTAHLVGEMQAWPPGGGLADGPGGVYVDLWIAQTRFGAPWVVLGTAESEEAFWREVENDDDLAGLGPIRPALRERAFFLTDADGPGHPAGAV
ncbi:MAG TPA: hypothetical protein VHG08_25505 [Longimicrobium sp.]|nr:hypothetical protein [Longimicrobium sp.]